MKLKITNKDGVVFEIEGNQEECKHLIEIVQLKPAPNKTELPPVEPSATDVAKFFEDWIKKNPPIYPYPYRLGDPNSFPYPYTFWYYNPNDTINTWPYRTTIR